MRKTSNSQEKLNSFLQGIVNAKIITVQLAPLLAVDFTAVPTLKEIYAETRSDYTQNGRILNKTSSKLLRVLEKSRMQYLCKNDFADEGRRKGQTHQVVISKEKMGKQRQISKIKVDLSKEVSNRMVSQQFNDENHNILNIERKNYGTAISSKKDRSNEGKLVEIIRPQYKKKINLKSNLDRDLEANEQIPTQMRSNRTYVTESEEEEIPIVRNKLKSHRELGNHIKKRSVSPKHESRQQQQINNISAISRNYQTQTDHSFEIDLQSMGFVPQVKKKTSNYDTFNSLLAGKSPKANERASQAFSTSGLKARDKMQGEIQQQQPWECDEQQIEEQIRQINQRLSHRAYSNSQRAKTEYDITHFESKGREYPLRVKVKVKKNP